jgi:hypothetical protein
MEAKQILPNSTATLVLGILSIVLCFCYGLVGLILGIIALAISSGPKKMYLENPSLYEGYPNLKAGRVCAIIGVSLSATYLAFLIIYFIVVGSLISLGSLGHQY